MAGMMRKGMSWLGLGPEEDYDEYVEEFDDEYFEEAPSRREPTRPVAVAPQSDPSYDDVPAESGAVRVLPQSGGAVGSAAVPARSIVRPLPSATARPHLVTPTSFNDAQEVGDRFKRRDPVVINLQGLDRDLARRLLDFASGVTYALGGRVERIASHVYLLTPVDVEVSAEDRERAVDELTSA